MKKFELRKDQIDFSRARFAPVINCVLKYKNKILLVQRSQKLGFYPGYWNGISGFLDDRRTLFQKIRDEIKEETGLERKNIISIKTGQVFLQEEPKYRKTWIVVPVLVQVNDDAVKLDWEAKNFRWITFSEAKKLKLLPGFEKVLKAIK